MSADGDGDSVWSVYLHRLEHGGGPGGLLWGHREAEAAVSMECFFRTASTVICQITRKD